MCMSIYIYILNIYKQIKWSVICFVSDLFCPKKIMDCFICLDIHLVLSPLAFFAFQTKNLEVLPILCYCPN